MRVSRLLKPQPPGEDDRVPPSRLAVWGVLAVVVIVGVVLFFAFSRGVSSIF